MGSISVADKTYDGGAGASVSAWSLTGVLAGDVVAVGAGSAAFADARAGVGKAVVGTATALSGAGAANYVLAQPVGNGTASILPALLSYVADAAEGRVASPPPPLTGSVTGFVAGETLTAATTGLLGFSTPATAASPAGSYAIVGGGLQARDYLFSQAPGNASAFTLRPQAVQVVQAEESAVLTAATVQEINSVQQTLLPVFQASTPTSGRVLDVLQAVRSNTGEGTSPAFGSVALGSLSQDAVATLLAARDQFKKAMFAEALAKLEQNPALADVPNCQSFDQTPMGSCLMTESLRDQAQAARVRVAAQAPAAAPAGSAAAPRVALAPPVATPSPAPSPSPAPALAPAAAPAGGAPAPALAGSPSPAASPAPAAPPAPSTLPSPPRTAQTPQASPLPGIIDPPLPTQRRVQLAALPQIQRKIAVLIGIDNYADKRIPTLDNAVSDAQAVAQTLEQRLGYETLVLHNASRQTILRTLNKLALELEPQDSVVVYYAGHGEVVEKTGQGYWQPADADATRPETWISNNDIGRLLGQFAASQVALISDSCFSGTLLGDERIRGVAAGVDPGVMLQRRAAVVMTSGGNEPVFDAGKNGHSPFAWNLMRTLERVQDWRPGSNVFESVRFAVARDLPQRPQYGASKLGGHQSGSDYLFESRRLEGGR